MKCTHILQWISVALILTYVCVSSQVIVGCIHQEAEPGGKSLQGLVLELLKKTTYDLAQPRQQGGKNGGGSGLFTVRSTETTDGGV